jgi:hypothetical protein
MDSQLKLTAGVYYRVTRRSGRRASGGVGDGHAARPMMRSESGNPRIRMNQVAVRW